MIGDRNLLFGIIALQNDFVTKNELIEAMNAWVLDKQTPLGEIMLRRGALENDGFRLLDALVGRQIAKHDGDVDRSLAALEVSHSVRNALASVHDNLVQATLESIRQSQIELSEATRPLPTTEVGGSRYQIVRPHAAGGLGQVFIALDSELHREIALKLILDSHADQPEARSRFIVEAEVTGGLEHPGIVPVYGMGKYPDGRPYYAMRFIHGDSLRSAIEQFHRQTPDYSSFDFRNLLRRLIDVCNAIAYAHSRGVLHRDIKPGNIMLGKYGETLVVDWGLAKALGKSAVGADISQGPVIPASASGSGTAIGSDATIPGVAIGTPAYMSPEQAAGNVGELGPATDVYSLGATLFCILTGKPPVQGNDLAAILQSVLRGEIAPPCSLQPAVPQALESICKKAMARSPASRYPSALALASDLEQWLADEPVMAHREPMSLRTRRWIRKHPRIVAGTAAAVLVGLTISILSLGIVNSQKLQLAKKNDQLDAALVRESIERQKAQASQRRADAEFRRAKRAIDEYFTDVSESKELKEKYPGMHEFRLKLLRKAQKYYEEFLKERGDDTTLQAETARAFSNLAIVAVQLTGQKLHALANFQRAKAILERLVQENPSVSFYVGELAGMYVNVGANQQSLGQTQDALASYQRALALYERLTRESPSLHEYAVGLAQLYGNRALLEASLGRHVDSLASQEKALAIREKLARDNPSDPKFAASLAQSHHAVGVLQASNRQFEAAVGNFEKSLSIQLKLMRDNPDVIDYTAEAAMNYDSLGLIHFEMKRFDDSLANFQKALAINERNARENPLATEFAFALGNSCLNLGILQSSMNHPIDALASFQKAQSVLEKLATENPKVTTFASLLVRALHNVGALQTTLNKPKEALLSYQKALVIEKKLVRENADIVQHVVDLGACYCSMGELVRDTDSPSKSLDLFDDAIRTLAGPAKTDATARNFLRDAHFGRGRARLSLDRLDDAIADFDRALPLDDGSGVAEIRKELELAARMKRAKQAKDSNALRKPEMDGKAKGK